MKDVNIMHALKIYFSQVHVNFFDFFAYVYLLEGCKKLLLNIFNYSM